jgi:hypothetical protein
MVEMAISQLMLIGGVELEEYMEVCYWMLPIFLQYIAFVHGKSPIPKEEKNEKFIHVD